MESDTVDAQLDQQTTLAEGATPEGRGRRRKLVVALIVLGVIAALALATGVGLLAGNLARSGGEIAGEWQQRAAKDYPGWDMVGFNFSTVSNSEGTQTDYTLALVPPDRDFAVGIVYTSKDGRDPVCQDETLRPGQLYSPRAESLLDHIESTYVADGKTVVSVTTEIDGSVVVSWVKRSSFLVFTSTVGSFDVLEWDSESDTWDVEFSPDALPS